jgi:hypothetical protein
VLERGVWKIDEVSNAAQVSGTFAAGLSASPGSRPALAFHYVPADVGSVDRDGAANPPEDDALQPGETLAALTRRLDRLDDEASIVKLQHQLGFHLDRHEWDAVAGLFAEQGRFEHGLQGVYVGEASVRRALDRFGDAPLPAGEIDDHIFFQTYVSISPDGETAKARVDELGLEGNPEVSARWTQGIYENSFVKEGGEWRVESLRFYPRLITDYVLGWGADAQAAPGPSATLPADAPPTDQYGIYPEFHIPPFHFTHPVTGRPPQYPEGDAAATEPIGFAEDSQADADEADAEALESKLAVAEEGLQRALAVDAVENLIAAYAFYLDECMTTEAAALFAASGELRIGDGAASRGTAEIANALQAAHCAVARTAGDMTLHHVSQPVITVNDDGETASFAVRLWEIGASNEAPDTYRGGMLEGEASFASGQWRLSTLGTRYSWAAAVPMP